MKGEKGIIPARMAFNPQTIGNHMRFRGKGHGARAKLKYQVFYFGVRPSLLLNY